ncbi:MAG: hypothetical protein KAW41_03445 [Candidatus Diapherotrites archaeon]|nr:hypothetical protein [Candidatus Diapherotrites archaeon]
MAATAKAEQFMKLYTSLPLSERQLTVVVIAGEPYNWQRAHTEVIANTKLGMEILKKLAELNII